MNYTDVLLGPLDQAVRRGMGSGDTAILFSGGLDSGVLAGLAKRHGRPRLYTVGIEGCHDLQMSEEAADVLGLPWVPLVVGPEDVIEAARAILAISPVKSPVVLSFELPLQMVASRAAEAVLLSGQGADELFGGYNRYLSMSVPELEVNLAGDIRHVLDEGVPLDRNIASRYGKTMSYPFLDDEVLRAASYIPAEEKVRSGIRKAPLRDVASALGLEIIARREKKAAQYGSGFMKVLKSEAKKEGLDVRSFVKGLGPKESS